MPAPSFTSKILLGRTWRFERAGDAVLAPQMSFDERGTIIGSTHSNETEWRLVEGRLEFLNAVGIVTTRFDDIACDENGLLFLRGRYIGSGSHDVVHTLTEQIAHRSRLNQPRIAVLVRTHLVSDKLSNLLDILSSGVGYDLFVCADETYGKLPIRGHRVISHNTDMCAKIGLVSPRSGINLLWYFGDYAFYCVNQLIPDYDYYVMVEYDVEFVRGNALALEGILRRLTDVPGDPYDLVATHYGTRPPAWGWGRPYEGRLDKIYGVLFPFVVLSKRALTYLYDQRCQEAANPPADEEFVFCEAFVPTTLVSAGGFRCDDVSRLLPGCWEPTTFRVGTPMLENALPPLTRKIEMVHPVFSEREYLKRMLDDAGRSGQLAEFIVTLSAPESLLLTPSVRSAFLSEATQLLEIAGLSR